ncbi:MAG: hypothetical protein IKW78_00660, partial [Prevotella sp.]|nr:hypothetical protein [Prevotella sp.]
MLEVVADLDESMAGLRFLFGIELVLLIQKMRFNLKKQANMKKMMFTIMALFVAVNICAQQSQTKLTRKQKKKVKIANELDVLKYLPSNSDGKQITFWQAIVDNNDDFKTIMSKFDNPSGLAKQA